MRTPIVAFWDRVRVLLGPESIPYQEILRREIEDYYATNPYTLLDAAESIDDRTLSNVASSMNTPIARLHLLAGDEQKKIIESTPADTLLQYRVRRDPEIAKLARCVVLEQLEVSADARFEFARQVFSLDPMHESLRARIKDATVRLKKENNDLYQEYDRMIAEGEFRRGVAIPLMALLLVISVTLIKALSLPVTLNRLTVPAIVAVVIGGSIYRAGTHRVCESLAFMYSCINLEYVGLNKRAIFGAEMFIPHETSNFVRRSEFSYRFEEFRSDLRLQALDLTRRVLRTPNRGSDTDAQ